MALASRGRAPASGGGSRANQLGGRFGTPEGTTIYLLQWRRPHWRRDHAEWPGRRYYVRRAAALRLARALVEDGAEVRLWTADLGAWSRAEW